MQNQLDQLIQDSGYKQEKFVRELGFTYETWRTRRKNPLSFSLPELVQLSRILKKEPTEVLTIILAENPLP